MRNNIVEKLKSKVVWCTAIPVIVHMVGMAFPAYAETVGYWMEDIVLLLAIFGILNNPNDKENF